MKEGVNLPKSETTKDSPWHTTSTSGKTLHTHEEHLAEGGATMLNQDKKTTISSVDIVANSAIMR